MNEPKTATDFISFVDTSYMKDEIDEDDFFTVHKLYLKFLKQT